MSDISGDIRSADDNKALENTIEDDVSNTLLAHTACAEIFNAQRKPQSQRGLRPRESTRWEPPSQGGAVGDPKEVVHEHGYKKRPSIEISGRNPPRDFQ